MNELRTDIYNDLLSVGYSPADAWELVSHMDFADDYED